MHFDDRLATVLRLPSSGDGLARIQFRQLVDILGHAPQGAGDAGEAGESGGILDAGFARLEALGRSIPPADRARLLRQPLQPMSNPRLLAWLAEAEPEVACAAIRAARLDEDAWLALVPRLPVRARGILRHRRDLPPRVEALLERLGVRDRALPPLETAPVEEPVATTPVAAPSLQPVAAEAPLIGEPATRFHAPTGDIAVDQDVSADVLELLDMVDNPPPPTSLSEWARARAAQHQREAQAKAAADPARAPGEAGIGAIVRRIEEFRKAREAMGPPESGADAPRLPLGDSTLPAGPRLARMIDFATDADGRITWADGPHASSVIGLNLASAQDGQDAACGNAIAAAMRGRLPLRAARVVLRGAPAVAGRWHVDAAARFEAGAFAGYWGRMRRPQPVTAIAEQAAPPIVSPAAAPAGSDEADRMRQVLHELRTPANAIQVAAEIVQQQLYGPAPHEYRALAAAIAGDCAHILAGFEELDRLVKLESGVLPLEPGECDLSRVLALTLSRLGAWTQPRRSGFVVVAGTADGALPVGIEPDEAERLIWRLFAALAGSTAPDEALELAWIVRRGMVEITVALPAVLAARPPEALFEAVAGERGQSLATGMFGIGFTLRLAAAEAAAAGGMLQRVENSLRLTLPALTPAEAGNSNSATNSH